MYGSILGPWHSRSLARRPLGKQPWQSTGPGFRGPAFADSSTCAKLGRVDFKAQTSAEAEDQDPLVEAVTALFKSDPVFGKIQDLIQVFPWMAWLFGLVLRCLPLLSAKMRKAAEVRGCFRRLH